MSRRPIRPLCQIEAEAKRIEARIEKDKTTVECISFLTVLALAIWLASLQPKDDESIKEAIVFFSLYFALAFSVAFGRVCFYPHRRHLGRLRAEIKNRAWEVDPRATLVKLEARQIDVESQITRLEIDACTARAEWEENTQKIAQIREVVEAPDGALSRMDGTDSETADRGLSSV